MTPAYRDIAQFAKLGLDLEMLTAAQIRSWADSVIAASEDPPAWTIDLCMAQLDEMIGLLEKVPGSASDDLALKMLLGLLYRRWKNGSFGLEKVVSIGFQLHLARRLPRPKIGHDWGVTLQCLCEDYRSDAELMQFIDETFAPYAAYEVIVPDWA